MKSGVRKALESVTVAVAYYVAARFGLLLAFEKTNASPVWPPSGIAFAAVRLWGPHVWPGILAGALLANFLEFLSHGTMHPAKAALVSVIIAGGNTLEALAGGWLAKRFMPADPFARSADFFRYTGIATAMCLVGACVGSLTLLAAGLAPARLFGTVFFTWWLGDLSGVLVTASLILNWSRGPIRYRSIWRWVEVTLLFISIVIWAGIAFGNLLGFESYPIAYSVIPFFVWAAFRFGRRETAAAVFVGSNLAIWGTVSGYGGFLQGTVNESLLLVQTFVVIVSVTVLAMAVMIHERRRLESQLKHDARELAASNRELASFASVASHDLQEPLRKITAFGKLILDNEKSISADSRDFLGRMERAAMRMQKLIDGLLTYSRITREPEPLGPVDLNEVMKTVLSDLELRIREAEGEVRADRLPVVMADESQMYELFQNLLSNALKFRRPGAPARITVGCRESGKWREITVEDEGIGFEPQHAEKIFEPFQRLHSREAYEGTGIGLSICRRIVDRHGGIITAKAEPGKKTLFLIRLPKL